MTSFAIVESPVGELLVTGSGGALTRLQFLLGRAPRREEDWVEDAAALRGATRQIEAYFAGSLKEFDLEIAPEGTPFQLAVWHELCKIPYGETISYGELARRLGNPGASRAVGLANGANPIAIVVPCHRVIGANGKLTGFGGGLDVKERLLALERGEGFLAI